MDTKEPRFNKLYQTAEILARLWWLFIILIVTCIGIGISNFGHTEMDSHEEIIQYSPYSPGLPLESTVEFAAVSAELGCYTEKSTYNDPLTYYAYIVLKDASGNSALISLYTYESELQVVTDEASNLIYRTEKLIETVNQNGQTFYGVIEENRVSSQDLSHSIYAYISIITGPVEDSLVVDDNASRKVEISRLPVIRHYEGIPPTTRTVIEHQEYVLDYGFCFLIAAVILIVLLPVTSWLSNQQKAVWKTQPLTPGNASPVSPSLSNKTSSKSSTSAKPSKPSNPSDPYASKPMLDDPTFIRELRHSVFGPWQQYDVLLDARPYGWVDILSWADYITEQELDLSLNGQITVNSGAGERNVTEAYMQNQGKCTQTPELKTECASLSVAGLSSTLKAPVKIVWINQTRTLRLFVLAPHHETLMRRYIETVVRRSFGTADAMKLAKTNSQPQKAVAPQPAKKAAPAKTVDVTKKAASIISVKAPEKKTAEQSSIGGLKILEIGASEICHNHFGQSTIYFHVADSNNSHFILMCDIGNAGYGFNIFPVDHLSENLKVHDLQWCREFVAAYRLNLSRDAYRKTTLVLNKTDFNKVFSMLGYNGNSGNATCSVCGKSVSNWYYAKSYICPDCVKKQHDFSYKY